MRAGNGTPSGDEPIVLSTKITIPSRRTASMDRPRLLERLHQGRTQSRLTVLAAPAGFGKTTLARQWALTLTDAVAWVSLDINENDPLRFLTYLTMAIRRCLPGFGDGVLSLVRSPQPPVPAILVTVLLNALCETTDSLTIVLDDYHLISERTVHESVTYLLEHLPFHVHLVIASRVDPPLSLARLRARGELTEIRALDLRCAGKEAAVFFGEVMGLRLPEEQLNALAERTEGWMAGLQLAGLSLQHCVDTDSFITAFTGSNRFIVDYLGEEVLRQQPEVIRRFLCRTAILDRLHGPLCEAVVGDLPPPPEGMSGQGQAILEAMETANLFLVPLDDNRRWYRYHHLFGDMLRARLLLESEAEIPELHRRAMRWYETNNMKEEAIHHALVGSHFSDAVRLMEDVVDEMWLRGEGFTPRRWFALLPFDYLRRSIALLLLQARYYIITAEPDRMETILQEAEALLQQEPENRVRWGEYKALRAFQASFQAKDDHAIALAEEALATLPPEAKLWPAIIRILLSTIYSDRGDVERAIALCADAATECERIGDPHVTLVARSIEGSLYESKGDLARAATIYTNVLEFARSFRMERLPMAAGALNGMGSIALEKNDLIAARSFVTQAKAGVGEADASDGRLRGAFLWLRLLLIEGDLATAEQLLDDLTRFAQTRTLKQIGHTVDAFRAFFSLAVGDIATAEEWRQMAQRRLDTSSDQALLTAFQTQSGPPSLNVGAIMAGNLVRLRYLQQDRQTTRMLATSLCENLERQGRRGTALPYRLLRAILSAEEGDVEGGLRLLTPALSLAGCQGYVRPFVDAGSQIIPLLQRAMDQGIEPGYASDLLAVLDDADLRRPGQSSPPDNNNGICGILTEREVEVLQLVAAGLSNQDIADRLFLSVGTVKRHLHNILGKLDADNRVTAIARARALGIAC